jgi:hypothetical protein
VFEKAVASSVHGHKELKVQNSFCLTYIIGIWWDEHGEGMGVRETGNAIIQNFGG